MAITNIYKGDVERSDIQKIYKGTTLLYEKVLPQGETWVLNEIISEFGLSYDVSFVSNNQTFESLWTYISPFGDVLTYGDSEYVYSYTSNRWSNEAYRTITFETAPTGYLLTWLQANAVKQ